MALNKVRRHLATKPAIAGSYKIDNSLSSILMLMVLYFPPVFIGCFIFIVRYDTRVIMHGTFYLSQITLSDESVCRIKIVDDCSFGRIGLQESLLSFENKTQIKISVSDTLYRHASASYNINKRGVGNLPRGNNSLIIRLSKSPLDALATLLLMGRMSLGIYVNIVVLSHIEPDLLKRILLGVGLNRTVKILDDRLPVSVLWALLQKSVGDKLIVIFC